MQYKTRTQLLLGIIMVMIVVGVFVFLKNKNTENQTTSIRHDAEVLVNQNTYQVQVARTQEDQERGLSGVKQLKKNEGMLFLFSGPGVYGMWMKDMNFPIDVLWLSKSDESTYTIVGVERNISEKTYPKTFTPRTAIDAFLELPAGSIDKITDPTMIIRSINR